ncbi:roadblock/LC7 domain-containing protein [Streptomyces sp. NPDC005648]|uniref:roadblock/LC7 domain-containing protein n=1 Tax=Streptomyces sp. NPDC005648 TaxID=3157044 RepID=UPI0033B47C71
MAPDPHILDELRRLRARVPQLTGALATAVDEVVLAQDTPGVDPQGVAALTAATHAAAVKLADASGQGDFRELLVRGMYGYVATFTAGGGTAAPAVLTLLAQDRVNVGRLLLEGRRAATRIAELLDTHGAPAGRAKQPRPAKPAAAKTTGTRTRTPRAPRTTTTTNARSTTES